MTDFVQLRRHCIEVNRVKRGAEPFFEMNLNRNERVVQIDRVYCRDEVDRATVDYVFNVWVEARL